MLHFKFFRVIVLLICSFPALHFLLFVASLDGNRSCFIPISSQIAYFSHSNPPTKPYGHKVITKRHNLPEESNQKRRQEILPENGLG